MAGLRHKLRHNFDGTAMQRVASSSLAGRATFSITYTRFVIGPFLAVAGNFLHGWKRSAPVTVSAKQTTPTGVFRRLTRASTRLRKK
jgi:hypothetical protein